MLLDVGMVLDIRMYTKIYVGLDRLAQTLLTILFSKVNINVCVCGGGGDYMINQEEREHLL